MNLTDLKWDASGLVTTVAQDRHTGEVRMVAYANLEAVRRTLETGQAHFFSRSRQALWRKGETSGHALHVHEVWADCDADAVLYLVDPEGPSCHTGRRTCFFRRVDERGDFHDEPERRGDPSLLRLWDTLLARSRSTAERSYTKSLLEGGAGRIGDKLREEADELTHALAGESPQRVVSEAADLLYHACVGLLLRDVDLRDVQAELARRLGRSGHEEKQARRSTPSGE